MQKDILCYYKILGVRPNSSKEEIRIAYRKKAKELHPDMNKRENAHNQFVFLGEAYSYLMQADIGKAHKANYSTSSANYEEWVKKQREEARQKAQQYARMQYEEYKKTDHYQKTQAVLSFLEHLYVVFAVALLLCPLWGALYAGWKGFGMGVLLTLISVHLWSSLFTEKYKLSFSSFGKAFAVVFRLKAFRLIILSIINIFLFGCITFNTQFPFLNMLLILLVMCVPAFLFLHLKKEKKPLVSKLYVYMGIVPFLFNAVLFINYLFASNPQTEVYSFVHDIVWYEENKTYYYYKGINNNNRRKETTSLIYLDENKYEDQPWFRFFIDYEAMKNNSEITYVFEDGFFGLRVLKSYEFTK